MVSKIAEKEKKRLESRILANDELEPDVDFEAKLHQAKEEFEKKKNERDEKKKEHTLRIRNRIKKKSKLSKKTKKGQPVMKYRIENIFQKVQEQQERIQGKKSKQQQKKS